MWDDYEAIQDKIDYDPTTGLFKRWNGRRCGTWHKQGYLMIQVGERKYSAHRMAFLMMGCDIPEVVDHANGDRSDNRWDNLRAATVQQNNFNIKVKDFTNLSVQSNGKYKVELRINKKKRYFGCHELELAQLIRDCTREKYYKEFSNQEKLNAK